MPKNRDKQRANRKKYKMDEIIQERLDFKNSFNINDETPYQAVNNIINSKTKEGKR